MKSLLLIASLALYVAESRLVTVTEFATECAEEGEYKTGDVTSTIIQTIETVVTVDDTSLAPEFESGIISTSNVADINQGGSPTTVNVLIATNSVGQTTRKTCNQKVITTTTPVTFTSTVPSSSSPATTPGPSPTSATPGPSTSPTSPTPTTSTTPSTSTSTSTAPEPSPTDNNAFDECVKIKGKGSAVYTSANSMCACYPDGKDVCYAI